jgi:uncharacterized protein involved in exopolysaccharide biosynthesis
VTSDPRLDMTFGDLLLIVWQRRRQLVYAMLVGLVVGGVGSKLRPKKYTAHATFIGVSGPRLNLSANLGALGALASQFGITSLGGGDAAALSPYFYTDLITSDTILSQLATVSLRDTSDTAAPVKPMLVWIKVKGKTHADSIDRATRRLKKMIVVDLQVRTGVVKVSFTAKRPYLAAAAADTLLGLVNAFVGRDLRTRAGATRRFLQDRLAQVDSELATQQDKLRTFLEKNREYQNSPMLQFRQAELQRDLDIKRDLYTSVSRSLEEARMNEVKDTPLISIIDRPAVPTRPSGTRAAVNAILLAFFTTFAWLAYVLSRYSLARLQQAEARRG